MRLEGAGTNFLDKSSYKQGNYIRKKSHSILSKSYSVINLQTPLTKRKNVIEKKRWEKNENNPALASLAGCKQRA